MATTAPFDFDSLIPILAAHPLLQHIHCKQRLLLLNHNMHFLILFMLEFKGGHFKSNIYAYLNLN
jgi:hypothetical protein